ncbi:MAG: hypothetical protein GOVbin152_42 [Prokaryotic dsDNA virus sp.]|nr:MAG: hypothetical protein GOVbin152_42 [Prokaryotic dsDNA virus sp.]
MPTVRSDLSLGRWEMGQMVRTLMHDISDYIKTTWAKGREFKFPITTILFEMVKGIFDGANDITEI